MKKIIISIFILISLINAQTEDIIFPGLQGEQLLDSLVANYKPNSVLSYSDARDQMYALLDNENDTVTCVYTGYKVYVPYNSQNPRNYTNAPTPIMNCEHTWPKSKGAGSGLAETDIHHLFPTNEYANSARSSFPFDEIDDQMTTKWWRGVSYILTIPTINIDEYSEELTGSKWEPKEDHKGNVARAMFYFYTMYKTEANNADPQFFPVQKDDLYQWHLIDPPDIKEITRTNQIASYQDNKPNPFVLDTTLVQRAYFPTTGIGINESPKPEVFKLYQNYPNPFNSQTNIECYVSEESNVKLIIYNIQGRLINTLNLSVIGKGHYNFFWNGTNNSGEKISSGVYIYKIEITTAKRSKQIWSNMKKMILLN